MIWIADLLGTILLAALALVWATFALVYFLRARWEATSVGRSLMAFAVTAMALTGLAVLRIFFDDSPVLAWARAAALAGAATISIRLLLLLIATQRRERRSPDSPPET